MSAYSPKCSFSLLTFYAWRKSEWKHLWECWFYHIVFDLKFTVTVKWHNAFKTLMYPLVYAFKTLMYPKFKVCFFLFVFFPPSYFSLSLHFHFPLPLSFFVLSFITFLVFILPSSLLSSVLLSFCLSIFTLNHENPKKNWGGFAMTPNPKYFSSE